MRALIQSPRRPATVMVMLFVLGLAFVAPLVPQQIAQAAPTAVVINTNDAGPGSLRQAIADADAGGAITFAIPGDGPHTIALTGGRLFINKDLTVTGPGADLLTVRRSETATVDFSVVVINGATTTVSIDGLTISGGRDNSGGGIFNNGGTLTITNSTISGNSIAVDAVGGSGGGIFNNAGTLTISDSTISGNSANSDGRGGGIFINAGTLTITNSTISGNSAGAVDAGGSGGGIYNNGGTLSITNSTISSNSANSDDIGGNGGGIFNNGGTLTITNSTMSGNSASAADIGGSGGGIFNNGGTSTLAATIVANSTSGGNCTGTAIISLGYNLSSDATCFTGGGSNLVSTDPMLGPLADNGGPTFTHALLEGSKAINHIPETDCPTAVDQRGIERPQGDGCDIGAVEFVPAPTLTLPDEPIVAEATGSTGAAVPFEVSAVDWTDATIAVTCEAASEVVVSGGNFPLGDTTVECYATDSLNQTTEGDFTITVQDTTDPTITVPDDMTLYTTDPDGVVVGFMDEVSASDTVDPDPAIVCVPASGSLFAIGPHEVECTATDDTGNDATDTFTITITVIDTLQLLSDLAQNVRALDLPFWDEFGLVVLVGVADDLAGDGHATASCNFLELFSARVASLVPETIGQDDAEQLIGDAQDIQVALACTPER